MGLFIFLILTLVTYLWLLIRWTDNEPFIKILILAMVIWTVFLLISHSPANFSQYLK